MTTLKGNCFTFRGGDSETMRRNLENLLRSRLNARNIQVALEFL